MLFGEIRLGLKTGDWLIIIWHWWSPKRFCTFECVISFSSTCWLKNKIRNILLNLLILFFLCAYDLVANVWLIFLGIRSDQSLRLHVCSLSTNYRNVFKTLPEKKQYVSEHLPQLTLWYNVYQWVWGRLDDLCAFHWLQGVSDCKSGTVRYSKSIETVWSMSLLQHRKGTQSTLQ